MLKKRFCIALFLSTFFLSANLQAEYAEVVLLGTGTPVPSAQRYGPATLVRIAGMNLLFDAGRGVAVRLRQAGLTPDQIDHIFLTHLHSDHISAVDDVWITGWIWQRQQDLNVWGPDGTQAFVDNLRQAYAADIDYRTTNVGLDKDRTFINASDVTPGEFLSSNGVKITAFLVDHKPVEPAFGYRIEFGDRVIVISGDTTYSENLIKHAQDADLLIHEIAGASEGLLKRNKRLHKVMAYHTTPEQMIEVLAQTNPKMAVLNHVLLFGVDEQTVLKTITDRFHGEVRMGYDLMQIEISSSIKINSIN